MIMTTHYLLIGTEFDVLYMLMEYNQFVLYTIICSYFSYQSYSIMGRVKQIKKISNYLLAGNILYLSGFLMYFLVEQFDNKDVYDCRNGL